MGKCPVNQQELNGKMSLRSWFGGWKNTSKNIKLRNSILDNLSFRKLRFHHGADFSGSSLVNATISMCYFNAFCNYSFDRCDLQQCRFMSLKGIGSNNETNYSTFLEMIKKKKITFCDVKNLDQAIFNDEQIKSAIKETFSL